MEGKLSTGRIPFSLYSAPKNPITMLNLIRSRRSRRPWAMFRVYCSSAGQCKTPVTTNKVEVELRQNSSLDTGLPVRNLSISDYSV